ncbi:hypothetical protein AGMMS49982_08310 [Bacteroidia bacterium]|nr:hypothetical protein AGMMS49982_08310 [Bacteroidia bacterium]
MKKIILLVFSVLLFCGQLFAEVDDILPVPEEFVKASQITDDGTHLEAPKWHAANASFTGSFAGYKPEMQYEIIVYVNNLITGGQEEYKTSARNDGTFELAVPLIVSTQVLFRVSYEGGNRSLLNDYVLLSPAKETRFYCDLPAYFRHRTVQKHDETDNFKEVYFAGANAEINNLTFDLKYLEYARKIYEVTTDTAVVNKMTLDEYKNYILKVKQQCIDSLLNSSKTLTVKVKEFFTMGLDYQAARELNFATNNWEPDSAYYDFLADLPLNNPASLYHQSFGSFVNSCQLVRSPMPDLTVAMAVDMLIASGKIAPEDVKSAQYLQQAIADIMKKKREVNELDKQAEQVIFTKYKETINSIVSDYRQTLQARMVEILGEMVYSLMGCQVFSRQMVEDYTPLSEEAFAWLKQLKDPFFAQYMAAQNNKVLAKIEENKSKHSYHANDVSGKEKEDLFEAVIGKEKGRVVLVDFWATWCAPCRMANKMFLPVKSMIDPEKVAFVYLTDESSPFETWQNMIPDLSGEHYRLSRDQYLYVMERLNVTVNSIPTYLILDKNGEQVFHHVAFPGVDVMMSKINEAMAR